MKNGICFGDKTYCLEKLGNGLIHLIEIDSSNDFSTTTTITVRDDISFFNATQLGLFSLIDELDMIQDMAVFFKNIIVYSDVENYKTLCKNDYEENYVFITDGLSRNDSENVDILTISFLFSSYHSLDLFDILMSDKMSMIENGRISFDSYNDFENKFGFILDSQFLKAFKECLSIIDFDKNIILWDQKQRSKK